MRAREEDQGKNKKKTEEKKTFQLARGRRPGEEQKENRGEENVSAGEPSITDIFIFKCSNR